MYPHSYLKNLFFQVNSGKLGIFLPLRWLGKIVLINLNSPPCFFFYLLHELIQCIHIHVQRNLWNVKMFPCSSWILRVGVSRDGGQHSDPVMSLLSEAPRLEPRLLGTGLWNVLVQRHHRTNRWVWRHLQSLRQVQAHRRRPVRTNGPGDPKNTEDRQRAVLL